MIIRSDEIIHRPTAVCLGFFDGVHIGHQALITKAMQLSGNGVQSLIYTFDRHALEVLGKAVSYITPPEEKIRILAQTGADNVYIQRMDQAFMDIPPKIFVKNILHDTLSARHVVVGQNYRFGKNRAGSADCLVEECAKYDILCHVLPYVQLENQTVSSSMIRALILNGDIARANRCMRRPYALVGTVVGGRRVGRTLGFPTANLPVPENMVAPPRGVYATNTILDSTTYQSVTNVGVAPTFGGTQLLAETNLIDFGHDIYGRQIRVEFLGRLRPEVKFDSAKMLIEQIQTDVQNRLRFTTEQ